MEKFNELPPLVREILERKILHWNYRPYDKMPEELLNYGAHVVEIYQKENNLTQLPENIHEKLEELECLHLLGNMIETLPPNISRY